MSKRKGRTGKETQLFELPESKKPEPDNTNKMGIEKFVGLCKDVIKINFDQSMI